MAKHTVEYALKRLARLNSEGGSCWDADSNLQRLNDVRELIYERGDFEGTCEWGCVKIEDCECIYLPHQLETVRQAWIASRPVLVHNQHYMSLDSVGRKSCCDCSSDTRRAVQLTGQRRSITVTPTQPFSLKVLFDEDEGDTEIIFRGNTYRGEKFRHVATSAEPDGGDVIQDILEVVKPATKGQVVVFAVFNDGTQQHLATYPSDSINPRFSQMRVLNYRTGDCDTNLVVLAKKAYLPYTDYTELVDIESIQALRFGYQALNAQFGNRDQEYATKMQLMEDQLAQVDMNLSLPEGSVEGQPVYGQSLNPEVDPAWLI